MDFQTFTANLKSDKMRLLIFLIIMQISMSTAAQKTIINKDGSKTVYDKGGHSYTKYDSCDDFMEAVYSSGKFYAAMSKQELHYTKWVKKITEGAMLNDSRYIGEYAYWMRYRRSEEETFKVYYMPDTLTIELLTYRAHNNEKSSWVRLIKKETVKYIPPITMIDEL
jgi:hypothetical protein